MPSNDPTDARPVERFYDLLAKATELRAIDDFPRTGKRKNMKILFIEKDRAALAELAAAVRVKPLGAQFSLMMNGNPTLILSGPDGYLLDLQPLGDDFVRSDALPEDASLIIPGKFSEWIAIRAIDPGRT
jgi:hypothetical protein